jgi:hypothetical protein
MAAREILEEIKEKLELGVAQWGNACLVCVRLWVWSPALQGKKKKRVMILSLG